MERVPALVTTTGRESDMLEVLAVVQQSLESWKTDQRHTRHLIVDTGVLKKKRVDEKKDVEKRATDRLKVKSTWVNGTFPTSVLSAIS